MFYIEPNGEILDVSSENDIASLNVKTPSISSCVSNCVDMLYCWSDVE